MPTQQIFPAQRCPAGATDASGTPNYLYTNAVIDAAALGDRGIQSAVFDFYVSSTFTLQNLVLTKTCNLSFYGSHKYNTDNTTVYTVYTSNNYSTAVASASLLVGVNALHNSNRFVTISNVAPQWANSIWIGFKGSSGNLGYLNAMKIDVMPAPPALPGGPSVPGDASWGQNWSFSTNNAMRPKVGRGGAGTNFWGITVAPVTNGLGFKITNGPGWTTNWGSGYWINKDAVYTPGPGQGGGNMLMNNKWTTGAYAHLVCDRAQDGPANLQIGAMMLSAPPVAITAVAATASATAASVAIALGGEKCAEERVMLCFTINDWAGCLGQCGRTT